MNDPARTLLILGPVISCPLAIRAADSPEKRSLGVIIYTVVARLMAHFAISAHRNGRILVGAWGVRGVIEPAKSSAYSGSTLRCFSRAPLIEGDRRMTLSLTYRLLLASVAAPLPVRSDRPTRIPPHLLSPMLPRPPFVPPA